MTELFDSLTNDMKQAMRDRDATRLSAIRMIRSALQNARIAKGPDGTLNDADAAEVLAREARQRRETIEEFRKAGRDETLPRQEQELAVVLGYMPQQISRDDIAEEARSAIAELGARGLSDRGKVMGKLMPALRGKADGRDVSSVVEELLSQ